MNHIFNPQMIIYLASLILFIASGIIVTYRKVTLHSILMLGGFLLMTVSIFLINLFTPNVIPPESSRENIQVFFNPSLIVEIGFWLGPVGSLISSAGLLIYVRNNRDINS